MLREYVLAIPVFNEAKSVASVIREARRYVSDILVIDDGSTDETPSLLRRIPGIRLLTHAENRGYGKSLADAFSFAAREGYRWLITMDCDEQHEPSHLPRFIDAIRDDNADLISGTRYPDGYDVSTSAPPDRREINRRITELLRSRIDLNITDSFCGFKAYRVSCLTDIHITVPGYAMPMQFWVQAVREGLRVRELPVRLIYNDPTRHFGGHLDDPDARFAHYLEVFENELASARPQMDRPRSGCVPCR